MPDITLCVNKECPLNEVCYRFVALPNVINQSYSFFQPYLNENKKIDCDFFKQIPNNYQNMYVHICKKELCPHCKQMSCSCEQKFENTTAGWNLVCPHCKGIMMQSTVTTSSIELTYYDPFCPHCHKYKTMQGNGIMHQLCECGQTAP